MEKVVNYAPEAWKMLHGAFCVYKPFDMSMMHLRKVIIGNLMRDLNQMKTRPSLPHIVIRERTPGSYEVVEQKNYADHPLVLGPRYQPGDFRVSYALHLDKRISGVCVMGINRGTSLTHKVREGRLIRTYAIEGKFGMASDTGFYDDKALDKILTKATFRHVTKSQLLKTLMTIQAGHQQSAVHFLGLDIQSQAAYEAVSADGLVRPSEKSPPLIYNIKLLAFNPPDFSMEVSCINESGEYLQHLVHKIGLQLRTNAVCTQMRCIRYGAFSLQDALLRKHWTLEHVMNNIKSCQPLIQNIVPVSPSLLNLEEKYLENKNVRDNEHQYNSEIEHNEQFEDSERPDTEHSYNSEGVSDEDFEDFKKTGDKHFDGYTSR